jgi:hypothetical protein
VVKGTFNVILGSASALTPPFNKKYFLEVSATAGPGISSTQTFSPRSELTSTPYSLQSLSLLGPGSLATGIAGIAGGSNNRARGSYSVVTGGGGPAATDSNSAIGDYSTISGGNANLAGGSLSTVSGGGVNVAAGTFSTVAGGNDNRAGDLATIGGGTINRAGGQSATVSGGQLNIASGQFSAIPGGQNNRAAGDNAVAAGNQAKANHNGSIVLAANTGSDSVASGGDEQVVLGAGGGLYITNRKENAPYDTSKLINTSSGSFLTTNGALTLASSLTINAPGGGAAISSFRFGSATLDFPSTSPQSASARNISVPGVKAGNLVFLGVPATSLTSGSCFTAFVEVNDFVSVQFNNYSSSTTDPASGVFRVMVVQAF